MRRGIFMISAAHTEEDSEKTLTAAERIIKNWN
jgi:hypothetical protein